MENDELQEQETLEPQEEVEETPESEETDDEPDYDTLKAKAEELEKKTKTLDAQRLHYKNKVEKLAEAKKKPSSDESNKQSVSDPDWQERIELKVEGYDDKSIDFIMRNGGKEALKDPYVQNAIKAAKEQAKAESATPSDKGYGTGAFKKMTEDQIKNLSSKEIEEKLKSGK